MTTYQTSIEIAADIDVVWRVLTQVVPKEPAAFGLRRIEGRLAANARIKLWSEVDPNRAFALTVKTFEPPRKMVWRGGMPFGLFTGTRTFDLTAENGSTAFSMTEVFSGPMSGMIVKSIPDLTPSFEKFARALKEKAEAND